MAKEYFAAYHSYIEAMESLNDAERGRLFTACLIYSKTGEVTELRGNERFLFPGMKSQIDRDTKNYDEKCETNRKNGSLGGIANATERKRTLPNALQTPPKEKEKEKTKDNANENTEDIGAPAPRKKYGQFGWVKLTEDEYNHLLTDLGKSELERCISHVDESAQASGNKNKWKDWNLVVRKCSRDGWGLKQGGQQKHGRFDAILNDRG